MEWLEYVQRESMLAYEQSCREQITLRTVVKPITSPLCVPAGIVNIVSTEPPGWTTPVAAAARSLNGANEPPAPGAQKARGLEPNQTVGPGRRKPREKYVGMPSTSSSG